MKKVYLAGKVTNGDTAPQSAYEATYEKFCYYEKLVQSAGFEVVNPVKLVSGHADWSYAMKVCIKNMMECDAIFLLPDYKDSKGARLEYFIANELRYELITEDAVLEIIEKHANKQQFDCVTSNQ